MIKIGTLSYNPETGVFVRVYKNGRTEVVGDKESTQGYAVVALNGKNNYAHRVAWFMCYGKWPDNQIDHINHNKLDNRIANLRDVTIQENIANRPKRGEKKLFETIDTTCDNSYIGSTVSTVSRMKHTIEVVNEIRRLYNHEGWTFKAIGEELGLSLNTVAGIVRRHIGHNRKGLVSAKGHGRKGSWKFKATMDAMFEPVPVLRRATTVPEPVSRELSVLDLQYGECKWMDDNLKACGAPAVDKRPYCEHHMQRGYVIRRSSTKKGWA